MAPSWTARVQTHLGALSWSVGNLSSSWALGCKGAASSQSEDAIGGNPPQLVRFSGSLPESLILGLWWLMNCAGFQNRSEWLRCLLFLHRFSVFWRFKIFRHGFQIFNWDAWLPPVIENFGVVSGRGPVGTIRNNLPTSSFLYLLFPKTSPQCNIPNGNQRGES